MSITPPLSLPLVLAVLAVLAAPIWGQNSVSLDVSLISDFGSTRDARNWFAVNDGVMGGVSRGGPKITEQGTLRFSGETSLENNGGFSSIRMRPKLLGLGGFDGLSMRVKGDGRTYKLTLRTDRDLRSGVSYWADFATKKDRWIDVRVPFSAFEAHFRGSTLGRTLRPDQIVSIGFMIYDKQAGPFAIEIDDLRRWRKGDRRESGQGGDGNDNLGTIPEVAKAAGEFSTLLTAVGAAGLAEVLSGKGPFTVFAPTDAAFEKLPKSTIAALLRPANRDRLTAILKNHVVAGRVTAREAIGKDEITPLGGDKLSIAFAQGRLRIGEASVVANDVEAKNGIIHVIDAVLVPAEPAKRADSDARLGLLVEAIDRGVPLFNGGNPKGCVAVYEVAIMAVLAWPNGRLSPRVRGMLTDALRGVANHSAESAAWALRRAMDAAILEMRASRA